jgi:hypothetical protein
VVPHANGRATNSLAVGTMQGVLSQQCGSSQTRALGGRNSRTGQRVPIVHQQRAISSSSAPRRHVMVCRAVATDLTEAEARGE